MQAGRQADRQYQGETRSPGSPCCSALLSCPQQLKSGSPSGVSYCVTNPNPNPAVHCLLHHAGVCLSDRQTACTGGTVHCRSSSQQSSSQKQLCHISSRRMPPPLLLALALLVLHTHIALSSSPSPAWSLDGKRILITGGSRGIGKAIVEEVCGLGAHVLVCGRDEATLQECLREWQERGFNVTVFACDVSTDTGRRLLIQRYKEVHGNSLDGLVNNVGTNIRKPTLDLKMDDYQRIMSTNLESAFFLSRDCAPLLARRESRSPRDTASIVNIGSAAGGCHTTIRSGATYAMTKAAMCQLSANLACEWAALGIRVNVVSPWYIRTDLAEQVLHYYYYYYVLLITSINISINRCCRTETICSPSWTGADSPNLT